MRAAELGTIGLLGGLSWESTSAYYATLNTLTSEVLGPWQQPPLLLASVNFAQYVAAQRADEWEQMASELSALAIDLVRAGADVIGIGANTMHIVADEIAHAIAPTPLVNLIDALADAALAAKVTHLGLLGTTYVTERSFFADRLEQRGVAALVPDEQARATLQRIIYDELTVGIVSDTSRCELLSIIDSLASHGAQAAALACTEFGLLIAPGTASLDTFDTMELHCRALLSAVGLRLPT